MARPLAGVRVLDMGTFITGPAAGVLLADLGAEVIKVEMPGTGDPFRAFKGDLYSPHYQTYNRNKTSIELNTKEPADLAAFDELVRDADVFIQNFRPGVAERLGVGPERLRGINPRLVYCGISGFGNDGPWKDRPAFDTVSQAVTGFLRLLVNPANPRVVGPAIGDAVTGFYAAFGVLACAVRAREDRQGPAGRDLYVRGDEPLQHGRFHALPVRTARSWARGRGRTCRRATCSSAPDGGLDRAAHVEPAEVLGETSRRRSGSRGCCSGPSSRAGRRGSPTTRRWSRSSRRSSRTQPRAYWEERLAALEVPHSPVCTSKEVVEGELAAHHKLVVEGEGARGTFRTIRFPVRFDGEIEDSVVPPPELGTATCRGSQTQGMNCAPAAALLD